LFTECTIQIHNVKRLTDNTVDKLNMLAHLYVRQAETVYVLV